MKTTRGKATITAAALQAAGAVRGETWVNPTAAGAVTGHAAQQTQLAQTTAPIPVMPIAVALAGLDDDVTTLELMLNELSARLAATALSAVPDGEESRPEEAGNGTSALANDIHAVRCRVRAQCELVRSLVARLEL